MSDSVTANYGWTKPEVGASDDTWGAKDNANLDAQDAALKAVSDVANGALPKSGGTVTGVIEANQFKGPSSYGVQGQPVASGASKTIFTVPNNAAYDGVWLVFATFGTGQGVTGIFSVSGGAVGTIARLTDATLSGAITLSVSGQSIVMTNNTVGTQSMSGAVTHFGGAQ